MGPPVAVANAQQQWRYRGKWHLLAGGLARVYLSRRSAEGETSGRSGTASRERACSSNLAPPQSAEVHDPGVMDQRPAPSSWKRRILVLHRRPHPALPSVRMDVSDPVGRDPVSAGIRLPAAGTVERLRPADRTRSRPRGLHIPEKAVEVPERLVEPLAQVLELPDALLTVRQQPVDPG